MGAPAYWLTIGESKKDIIAPMFVDEMLGDACQVSYDLNAKALRLSVPERPEYSYVVQRLPSRRKGSRISISVLRHDVPMPPGRYNVTDDPEVFLHEDAPLTTEFQWTPYSNLTRAQASVHVKVGVKFVSLTANAWEKMGEPKRVTIYADPVQATLILRPDPAGPHSLCKKNSKKASGRWRTSVRATIASIHETMPIGTYDPVSLGRFEGVFKLRGAR